MLSRLAIATHRFCSPHIVCARSAGVGTSALCWDMITLARGSIPEIVPLCAGELRRNLAVRILTGAC
jgi:hypothetical protein